MAVFDPDASVKLLYPGGCEILLSVQYFELNEIVLFMLLAVYRVPEITHSAHLCRSALDLHRPQLPIS